jgi:transcription antitermination factor NusG
MSESKQWHVIYTRSRAEKKVAVELDFQGIENYLPLHRRLRQWSDRKKWVEMPLISGYLFVHITPKEYEKVLKTFGVVSYVRFEGKAAIVPDYQIDFIKKMLREPNLDIEVSHQLLQQGDEIIVVAGPLIGLTGKLISFKGKKRVAVELAQLNMSLLVEVQISEIEKMPNL